MSLKYALICFVLFLIVLFLAERSYNALTHPLELVPDKGGSRNEAKPGNPPAIEIPKERPAIASYNVIADRNIFNPERKDFVAVGSGMSAKPMVRPQVILYGVTIAGDYRSASVVNPGRSLKKGEREQMTLKPGERIGEYRLAKVLSDRITMEAGEDTFEVFLYDPKAPKKRVETRTESKPAAIVNTQAPSTPTGDVKGGSRLPTDLGTPFSTPVMKPLTPKEAAGETKGPSQQQPSAQTTTPMTPPGTTVPPPGTAPTAGQVPISMAPTPVTSPFVPTPIPPPPDVGKPVPLPSGASPTGGK